jgi:hypothetical protein
MCSSQSFKTQLSPTRRSWTQLTRDRNLLEQMFKQKKRAKKKNLMYSSYLSMLIVKTKYRETLQQSIIFCKESYKAFLTCFNFSFNINFFLLKRSKRKWIQIWIILEVTLTFTHTH